jgi:replicative DNA helicase
MNAGPQQYRLFPENIVDGHLLDRPKVVPMQFFIKKNRNGEIGTSDPIKWNMATGNFQTLQRGTI